MLSGTVKTQLGRALTAAAGASDDPADGSGAMNHTEDDLRELFAERTTYGPGGDMDVAEIVRRGRRGRIARWSVGAVLAGAAATAVVWVLPGAVTAPAPDRRPSSSRRPPRRARPPRYRRGCPIRRPVWTA